MTIIARYSIIFMVLIIMHLIHYVIGMCHIIESFVLATWQSASLHVVSNQLVTSVAAHHPKNERDSHKVN